MPYLRARSMAFGAYIAPRQAPARRRTVSFAGHYGMQWIGLGSLGDADWSGFISTLQNAILPSLPPLPIGRMVMQQILGTYSPSPSQINPSVANQLILALGNFKLSGAAGAYRDALWQQLARYVASPPQLPAPAAPVGAPVGPAPIVAPVTSLPPTVASPTPGATGTYSGTPVPLGFPTNETFVDGQGNQWQYNATTGTWQNATAAAAAAAIASEQAQAAQIAAATATSPAGGPAPILVTSPTVTPGLQPTSSLSPVSVSVSSGSSYSDILNWLSESSLVSFAPNWATLAAVGLLALKLSGKKGLL